MTLPTRPTSTTLTAAGFTNVSGTRWTKSVGTTALAVVDLGAGTSESGFGSVQGLPVGGTTVAAPVTAADYASAEALLVSLGVGSSARTAPGGPSMDGCGLVYSGASV